MAFTPTPETAARIASMPSARSARSPAEYSRKKLDGKFNKRSQRADWIE